ncbi:MAG: DinB family protein, partial [Gemmatimonadaceae bacterium]|nr:DinB family protein [Chitinophagaceae bacterium]
MKKINTKELFSQMGKTIAQHIDTASRLLNESDDLLNTAPAPGKWSVVQVFEHLNSYGMYYLPAMEKAIAGKN